MTIFFSHRIEETTIPLVGMQRCMPRALQMKALISLDPESWQLAIALGWRNFSSKVTLPAWGSHIQWLVNRRGIKAWLLYASSGRTGPGPELLLKHTKAFLVTASEFTFYLLLLLLLSLSYKCWSQKHSPVNIQHKNLLCILFFREILTSARTPKRSWTKGPACLLTSLL